MSDIRSLERRITAALDRIRAGLDSQPSGAAEPSAAMQAALDRERAANAEMMKRLADLKERQEGQIAALTAEVAALKAERAADVAEMDAILAELKPLIAEA